MNDPAHESLDAVHREQLTHRKRKATSVEQDATSLCSDSDASLLAAASSWAVPQNLWQQRLDDNHDLPRSHSCSPDFTSDTATPRTKRPRTESHPPPSPSVSRPLSKLVTLSRNRRQCSPSRPDVHLRAAREKLKSSGESPPRQVKFGGPSIAKCSANGPGPSEGSLLPRWSIASPHHHLHCSEHSQPFIPSVHPPITRDTLRELDLEAILRNPQLRHDLLFDAGLQFRPTTSRRKREATDMYWEAVKRELQLGCTCFSFDEKYRHLQDHCTCTGEQAHKPPSAAVISVCEKTANNDRSWTIRMPSRIRPLIVELFEVILTIILPSPAKPGACGFQRTGVRRISPEHVAQVQVLRAGLDPALIEQELQHRLFDPSGLFTELGRILKCHCAPMRDACIDTMVEVAQTCAPGQGGGIDEALKAIRMCFELLEVMKLDIANHQLSTLRPFLIDSAPEFELKTFQERHSRGQLSIKTTKAWLEAAHAKLTASGDYCTTPTAPAADKASTPFAPFALLPRTHQVQVVIATALTDLIFFPPSAPPTTLPPLPTTTPINKGLPHIAPLPGYPDTLFLDHSRVLMLTTDVADLTALYMLLMLYRQLVFLPPSVTNTRHIKPKIEDAEIERLKKEIWEIGPPRLGLCFSVGYELNQLQTSISSQGAALKQPPAPRDAERWRKGMRDVILQVALRAEHTRAGIPVTPPGEDGAMPSVTHTAPSEHMIQLANGWCDSHLRDGSTLASLLRTKLRAAVWDSVVASLTGPVKKEGMAPARAGNGLDALGVEIGHLGQRVAKLAALHLWVYGNFYEHKGLIPS